MTKKKTSAPNTERARSDAIGRQLRLMYDSFTKEPLPEDMLELLAKLDEKVKKSGNGSESR